MRGKQNAQQRRHWSQLAASGSRRVAIIRKKKHARRLSRQRQPQQAREEEANASAAALQAAIEKSEKAQAELLSKFKQQKLLAGPLANQVKKAEGRL